MAAASSLSFVSAPVAPTTARCNGANQTTVAGRKYEIPSHNQCRPVADMQAKGRRKTTTGRKQKLTSSKSQGKLWPTAIITADFREPTSKSLAAEETFSTSLKQQELPDSHVASALLTKTPSKNERSQEDTKMVAASSPSTVEGLKKNTSIAMDNETKRNAEEIGVVVGDSATIEDNAAKEVAEDVKGFLVSQEATTTLDGVLSATVEDKAAKEVAEDVKGSLSSQEATSTLDGVLSTTVEDNAAKEVAEDVKSSLVSQEATTTFDDALSKEVENPPPQDSEQESLLLNHVEETSYAVKDKSNDQLLTKSSAAHEEDNHLSIVKTLSEKTVLDGRKIFFYLETLKAGSQVELFLNRAASTLYQQPSLRVRGAYNDWRWKSFEKDLQQQTDLLGDWWSCKLQIPKEAYKLDFVFNDGGSVYENNSNKDFSALVEDGMERDAFEDFLIDEEWKTAERIAAEKALEEKRIAEERRLAEKEVSEEADRHEAVRQANEQRERTSRIMRKAVKKVEGLWYLQPEEFQGGDTVKLFYNRSGRNLAFSKEVWIHAGYNNWQDMASIVGQLTFYSDEAGHWWTINVDVPKQAFVLNWVFADGPPEAATLYDNNTYQDFHALVPKGVPNDLYWRDLENQIFARLQEERENREEAARKKAQHTADIKAQFKAKTQSVLIKSREHIFYTDPVDVQAGKEVIIFYNPSDTVLNGKPEMWLHVSFNRWTHHRGKLPLVKMLPVVDSSYLKATVKVPLDAYMMDFVFSDREEGGGIFDNNRGMDYHVPVIGASTREPPMKVVHISVEMAPVAKVGGLGDVVTSLARAVQDLGHNVEILLPKYDCLKYNYINNLQENENLFWGGTRIKVWNGTVEGLPVVFLEPENGMYWAGCVYGRRDDAQRFGFFCHAALEYLLRSGRRPDIIHCHDWSSAPVAWLFHEQYKQSNLAKARVVFTIHNLEFGTALIGKAMAFSDKATTVSETYASEVSGNPAIRPHLYKFSGIRNGIDLDIWDPYNDPFIPLPYTSKDVTEGKHAAKKELQSRLGLAQADRPLVGIITRLTAQKGIHLIKHAVWRTLDRGGQVVLLGSAPDPRIQNDFGSLANQLHNSRGDMARLCLHYDEPLSHLIYAGADFILIPSMFEPCGLTQLIAMRYGAIPLVRRTGGLNDTVFDVDHDRDRARYHAVEPNGFSFDSTDVAGVDYALNRALSAWYEARDWFHGLCAQVMEQDWSWNRPALDYIELYHNAKK